MMERVITVRPEVFARAQKVRTRHASMPILLAALVGDTLVVFATMVLSGWLRFNTPLAQIGWGTSGIDWTDYLGRGAFGTLLFILLLPHRKMYDLRRMLRLRQFVPIIIKTALTWLFVFMALSLLMRVEQEVSRIYVVLAFAVTTSCFILWRMLLCRVLSIGSIAHRLRQRILFVGWSPYAASLVRAIESDRCRPYDIVGYVRSGRGEAGDAKPPIRQFAASGGVGRVLREREVDMVVLADLQPSTAEMVELAGICEREMVDFKIIPSCFEILLSCLELQTVSGVPVCGVSQLPMDYPFNVILKQSVDLLGAVVGLFLSAPIIALFAILVYWEDPGPIIYRQRRLGRDGLPFWMLKIRSMKVDAERGGKIGWTVKNDSRRLRVGAFMRRWNIDELPQFWNVIKGDMSLVGPRPERPELIEIFKDEIPHYNARHGIKPGMTGWAQVNGFRGDTDLTERVRCDLYYMENWSLLLDFQIMFMTVTKRTNAC